ncbi:MAG: hypothetical protein IKB99_08490 [Lentisphaeria bacterium]|nr:hypothetical protein [Lentisphaeria bacterium]
MNTYKVTDFGILPGIAVPQTALLQQLIDRCKAEGGGKIVFPAGSYVSGSLVLCRNRTIELELNAILYGSIDEKDYHLYDPAPIAFYEGRNGIRALLFALDEHNITIQGEGMIDGRSSIYPPHEIHRSAPRVIWFGNCENISVSGLIMQNSVFWMQHYIKCRHIKIHDLTVRSHGCENNDGIDIDSCDDVEIWNCRVDSGDDGICLKTGTDTPCSNVYVHDCILSSHCAAFKLGTESNCGYTKILAERLLIVPSENLSTLPGEDFRAGSALGIGAVDGAFVDNVTIRDVKVYGARTPLYMRWGNRKRGRLGEPGGGGEPSYFRNVLLENIQFHNAGIQGCYICGMENFDMENITLRNCTFEFPDAPEAHLQNREVPEEGHPFPNSASFGREPFPALLFVRHVKNFKIENVKFKRNPEDKRKEYIYL